VLRVNEEEESRASLAMNSPKNVIKEEIFTCDMKSSADQKSALDCFLQ
jgi:hypothetical protein